MYKEDPLIYHGALKAKWLSEFLAKVYVARAGLNAINLPTLLLHGTEDRLVPFSGSEYIYNNITSKDKEFEVCIVHWYSIY